MLKAAAKPEHCASAPHTFVDLGAGERRISQRTSNGYAQAMHSLGRWAVREGLLNENALAGGQRVRVTSSRARRALSSDEQRLLIETAQSGPERFGLDGPSRAILYATALGTGFRLSELAALRVRDFDLKSDPPTATLAASATKNRKPAVQPLPSDLAERLAEVLRMKVPDAKALLMPPLWDAAEMLRDDLEAARRSWLAQEGFTAAQRREREQSDFLQARTDDGVVDFHALRHTYGSNLARANVPVKTAMDLMRHSDVNLTMRLYSHTVIADRASAVALLPPVALPAVVSAKATGTDGGADSPAAYLAEYSAQIGGRDQTSVDFGGRNGENSALPQPIVNAAETSKNTTKNSQSARSSAGQSDGFLNRRSQVRILPGASRGEREKR